MASRKRSTRRTSIGIVFQFLCIASCCIGKPFPWTSSVTCSCDFTTYNRCKKYIINTLLLFFGAAQKNYIGVCLVSERIPTIVLNFLGALFIIANVPYKVSMHFILTPPDVLSSFRCIFHLDSQKYLSSLGPMRTILCFD